MSPKRLTDRYDVDSLRLHPDLNDRDRILVDAVRSLHLVGTVYHVLRMIPEQFEDEYVILIDDRLVVRFELPGDALEPLKEIKIYAVRDYRWEIGQGRQRILLDRAVDAARSLIAASSAAQ